MPDGRVLAADCARCVGLCCVAPAFTRSSDFPIDKPAGTPCPNLLGDHRCGVHAQLRERGFGGCVVFDCFGAGQRVTQEVLAGRDWRDDPARAFEAFHVLRAVHEVLKPLADALALVRPGPLRDDVSACLRAVDTCGADELPALRAAAGGLLARVSAEVRAAAPGPHADHRGRDLAGARLHGADLRAADLRGAVLIGADLRGADLRRADLLGADLRGADLRGADLAGALFVTRPQLESARGDETTRLPDGLARPAYWTGQGGSVGIA